MKKLASRSPLLACQRISVRIITAGFLYMGLLSGCADRDSSSKENVIYGENDISVIEGKKNHPWSPEFSAVALVTEKSKLNLKAKNVLIRPESSITDKMCVGEPLSDALAIGHCTGFLLSDDTLVTAKHCLELIDGGCENLAIVFDAYSKTSLSRSMSFRRDHVYTCKRALSPSDPALDLVLIELDRKSDRKPLNLRQTEHWDSIGELTVLGYPLGGRQRISKGGKFRSASESIYRAELDVFEGNSGSPIFASDRTVRGILVDGERDFEQTETGCLKVKRCETGTCLGEGFIPSEKIIGFLDQFRVLKELEKSPKKRIFLEKKSDKISIPDESGEAVEIKFFVERSELISEIKLGLGIDHPFPSDLLIYLISPSGKIINLSHRATSTQEKSFLNFSSADSDQTLYTLLGENSNGTWSLIVKDFRAMHAGFIEGAELELFSSNTSAVP